MRDFAKEERGHMPSQKRRLPHESPEKQVYWAVLEVREGFVSIQVDPDYGETLWPTKAQALQALKALYEDEGPWNRAVLSVVKVIIEPAEEEY